MIKLDKWFVVDMDDGVVGTFPTKEEACIFCREQHDDGRVRAGWKRIHPGLYEYESSLRAARGSTWWVGTREELGKDGWGIALEAYESGQSYNIKNDEWNVLAAPTKG